MRRRTAAAPTDASHRRPSRAYHHGALREALLGFAAELLDAEGVEAVTVRAVARKAGVTHAAPFNHFPTRSALLTALAATFFEQLAAAVREDLSGASGPDRVRSYARAVVDYGLKHPNRYRLMWRRDLLLDDAALQRAMDAIYEDLIAELSQGRNLNGKSAHTFAVALWSMAHGYVSLRLDGNFEDRKDEVSGQARFEAMLDLVAGPR